MTKLIVEMEMPKNMCCDCEISIDGFACKKSRMDGGKCPICGVLPEQHGDLIDRSELIKHDHQHYEYLSDEYYVTVRDIKAAPTIVPAERSET